MRILPVVLAIVLLGLTSCGPAVPAAEVAKDLRQRATGKRSATVVRNERLFAPEAVDSFYEARNGRPAWTGKADEVLEAIEAIRADGLNPADYHLEAIRSLLEERKDKDTAELEADLDMLLSDAMAGMIDHVRYGRVRPVRLNPAWNVNPREDAPPLAQRLAEAERAGSPKAAVEAARPQHFIYRGLLQALAELRAANEKGGWPTVPAGRTLKPGVADKRIVAVRRRLAATGELGAGRVADSTRYDPALQAAVKEFQQHHRLVDDAILDAPTIQAMNVTAATRAAQVRVNLERARWVLNGLSDEFLLVNLPAFKAYLIRGGKNEWETRTMIGQEARQTPSFRATMKTVVFNPDWTVPPTILDEDVLQGIRRGENMIAKKKLVVLDAQGNEVDPSSVDWGSASADNFPYTLRQPAGEDNVLGKVKFLFPNKYSIYLHDTPTKELFNAERRTFSSGCIRIEHPLELAERLLSGQDGWGPAKIQETLATGETKYVNLEHTLPVLIVYWTVSVGASGEIRYASDIYEQDPPLLAALDQRSAS